MSHVISIYSSRMLHGALMGYHRTKSLVWVASSEDEKLDDTGHGFELHFSCTTDGA